MKYSPAFPNYPPLFLIRITEKLRSIFLRLFRKFTHPNVAVFEMVHHFWLAAAVGVVAELGIADILKKGPKSIRELAVLSDTHEGSLYRLMRMLASHDIFREKIHGVFSLTPLAKSLQEDQVKYLVISHLSKLHFQMFSELIYSVRSGNASSVLFTGNELYQYISGDEKRNELFIKAMTNASMMQAAAILPVFSFGRYSQIIDIGGGQGLMMAALLQQYRNCRGIVFDLPQSSGEAKKIIERYDITDRCIFMAGNFFEMIPGGGDLYMLKSILHNWNDEDCLKILHNISDAMPPSSTLLVIESIIEEGNRPSFGKMTDILMMVSVGGKERTMVEYKALLVHSGFSIRKISRTVSPLSLIEAVKGR